MMLLSKKNIAKNENIKNCIKNIGSSPFHASLGMRSFLSWQDVYVTFKIIIIETKVLFGERQ